MPGVREKDLNPDTWIGLSFPLGRSNTGFFKQTKTILEQSIFNLENLLLTIPGERLQQPEFGSNLYSILFEQQSDSIQDDVEAEIKRVVNIWLPYINILEVKLLKPDFNVNSIIIKLTFSVSLNPNSTKEITLTITDG